MTTSRTESSPKYRLSDVEVESFKEAAVTWALLTAMRGRSQNFPRVLWRGIWR